MTVELLEKDKTAQQIFPKHMSESDLAHCKVSLGLWPRCSEPPCWDWQNCGWWPSCF